NTVSKKPKEERAVTGLLGSIWTDVAGVVLTLAAGALAAYRSVNKSFYQNVKIEPNIANEIENSKAGTTRILSEVREVVGEGQKRASLIDKLPKHHARHAEAMDTLLKEHYGIRNVFDRARVLRPHQKWEVAFNVLATMAVSLGAVAAIASSRKASQQQETLAERLDELEAQQSPQRSL
ncbi:MAG: hypothetical protein LW823_09255, partial [Rickettsiales bacterium]|nr:hypothetical protein [Rickettsiales bacterium]